MIKFKYLVLTFALATFLVGCSRNSSSPTSNPRSIKVKTMEITSSSQMESFNYVGVIEESSSLGLSFQSLGTIVKVNVEEGDFVKKGDVLIELDNTSAQNAFDASEATLKQAEDGYQRTKQIYENKAIADVQMIDIETKLQQARSQYNITKKALDDCLLKAPADGIVGNCNVEVGENVIIGSIIMTIAGINNVKVAFSIPENEVSLVNNDAAVVVSVAAIGDKEFETKGVKKGIFADAISRTYPANATLLNTNGELLPGMVCKVVINNAETNNLIAVPISSILNSANDQRFVWLADNGKAKRVPVTVGDVKGNLISVTSGLSKGDKIIVEGYQKVSEGDNLIEE